MRWFQNLAAGLAAIALAACGGGAAPGPRPPASWAVFRHLPGVVDLAGPRADGSFLVAAAGRLFTLERGGALRPFARGADGYQTALGTEPYLTLAGSYQDRGNHCSFGINTAFALEPGSRPGVIMIGPQGRARRFASLPPGQLSVRHRVRHHRTVRAPAAGHGGGPRPDRGARHRLRQPGVPGRGGRAGRWRAGSPWRRRRSGGSAAT